MRGRQGPFNPMEVTREYAALREFKSLQRVANCTGKESAEHPRGNHDDLANAVAGCLELLSRVEQKIPMVGAVIYSPSSGWSDEAVRPRSAHQAWASWCYGGGGDGGFGPIGGPTLAPP